MCVEFERFDGIRACKHKTYIYTPEMKTTSTWGMLAIVLFCCLMSDLEIVAKFQFHQIATTTTNSSQPPFKLSHITPTATHYIHQKMTATRPHTLNFITGNANKLAEVKAILALDQGDNKVELKSQALDLPELQGTIEEISKDKARRAAELVSEFLYLGKWRELCGCLCVCVGCS